ncbi:MAG: AMP-binding protein [Cyclobacteriaceae bacterium]|nr:AMP-binding protein [Cyclobacteriaceae bacterium]
MAAFEIDGLVIEAGKIPEIDIAALDISDVARRTLCFAREWISGTEVFLQKSSGSTGAPKNIHIYRKHMETSAMRTLEALQLQKGDRALLCLDPSYIAGKMMIVRALAGGLTLQCIAPQSNPLCDKSLKNPMHFAAMVPLQMVEYLQHREDSPLDELKVKAIILGGGKVSSYLKEKLCNITMPVYQTFGMTETVSHIALQKISDTDADECFHCLSGVDIQKDENGCLMIRADVTGQKWLYTNDLVEIHGKGRFTWLGRKDNIINSGGIKIIPEQVESIIEQHRNERFKNNLLIEKLEDFRWGEMVCIFIEGSPDQDMLHKMLSESSSFLKKAEMPKKICICESFAYTQNGKIQRKETAVKWLKKSLSHPQFYYSLPLKQMY